MKFNVEITAQVECSASLVVEANNDEEAEAIARESLSGLQWDNFGSYPSQADVMFVTVDEIE